MGTPREGALFVSVTMHMRTALLLNTIHVLQTSLRADSVHLCI
jgi:hypothetical protein